MDFGDGLTEYPSGYETSAVIGKIDVGTATVDFDLIKEKFASDVYQQLIKEVGEVPAIHIMSVLKSTVSSCENEKTVQQAVASLQELAIVKFL